MLVSLSGFNNRNSPSDNSEEWKSKLKVSAGLVPPEAVRENLFDASLLAAGGFLAMSGIPWLVNAPPQSPQPLPSCAHGVPSACSSVSGPKFPLFIRSPVLLG